LLSRIAACLRPTDTAARLGGDEFTILLEGIKDISDAIRVADRIQAELKLPLILGEQEIFTMASIGIAMSDKSYEQPEQLLRDADIAMYRAKTLGKARYEIFNTDMHTQAVARLQLENDLRRAIERHEFQVYYQPIVSLKSGTIIGFEALVRWQHPTRGLLSPEEFLVVVEETGLGVPVDQWVLRTACRQMREWQLMFPAQPLMDICVNFCSRHFAQPNIVAEINTVLQEIGLNAHSLKLEITENAIMENAQSVTDVLLQLKALGIKLAIDDFGTGYSSLGRLHSFPIDILKIDRSFIANAATGTTNLDIVATIVLLGHSLGMQVTAEGIETAGQLALLRELNCEYGQGYFFAEALNTKAAEALIVAKPQW
jgi:EAL domain-containing protein (putative c-di-GMP-specific phosphodiesterase class I)